MKFDINERFEFVGKLATMVAKGQANSLIVSGEGGLGKTYTIMESVKKIGCGYKKIGGYSTAKGLYQMLYDYNGELFIFDDCDTVLEDKTAQNLLKIALDSNENRVISWSMRMNKNEEYPQEFKFTGKIIFITNKPQEKIFQPLLTRAYKVDLTMNSSEKIYRMKNILEVVCNKNDYSINTGNLALEFIDKRKNVIKSLSLRTLLDVMRIINSTNEWERLAEYTILQ